MKTLTIEWCFVQERDGSFHIIESPPDHLYKGPNSWSRKKLTQKDWYRVLRKESGEFMISTTRVLPNTIDFTNVPIPKWEDEQPIVIVQHININQNYYTVD